MKNSLEEQEEDIDIPLLLFSAGFNLVHAGFVFIAGVVHASSGGDPSFFPGWLAILSSVVSMGELVTLLAFFMELKAKVLFPIFIFRVLVGKPKQFRISFG